MIVITFPMVTPLHMWTITPVCQSSGDSPEFQATLMTRAGQHVLSVPRALSISDQISSTLACNSYEFYKNIFSNENSKSIKIIYLVHIFSQILFINLYLLLNKLSTISSWISILENFISKFSIEFLRVPFIGYWFE
jgi:hypothetical protein